MDDAATVEKTADRGETALAAELAGRFHWGACGLGWIWALAHCSWVVAVLDLILLGAAYCGLGYTIMGPFVGGVLSAAWVPVAGFGCVALFVAWRVFLGRRGYALAWRRRGSRGPDEFRASEQVWCVVGFIFGILTLAALLWYVCAAVFWAVLNRWSGPTIQGMAK